MLTAKQQAFVDAKVAGMTNKRAAMTAGYAAAGAGVQASNMMKKANIKAAIKEAKQRAGMADTRDEREARDEDRRLKDKYANSLELLQDVYNNPALPFSVRVQAAKDALPYEVGKPNAKGKKASKDDDAREVASASKFAPGSRPKLRAVG